MRYWVIIFSLILFSSCQKENSGNDNGNMTSAKSYSNVAYGTDPSQVMDVYLPEGRSAASTKFIVLIHGGAWSSGDKSEFNQFVDTLKRRLPGYAVFNINYRLANFSGNYFPTQENDVKSAMQFILGKTTEYGISEKYVLLGASAGAHLALLNGYKNPNSVKAKVIIDFFGPTDLVALHDNAPDPSLVPLMQLLLGGTPTSNPSQYTQSSPVNFVNSQSPPTLILQGGLDNLVPPSQSTALRDKLQTAGTPVEYLFYPLEGHGWFGTNLTHSFNAIEAFLAVHVN